MHVFMCDLSIKTEEELLEPTYDKEMDFTTKFTHFMTLACKFEEMRKSLMRKSV